MLYQLIIKSFPLSVSQADNLFVSQLSRSSTLSKNYNALKKVSDYLEKKGFVCIVCKYY